LSRGKIFAPETDQKCSDLLSGNISANKAKNTVFQTAIWSGFNLSMELASASPQSYSLITQFVMAIKLNYVQQAIMTKSIDDLVAEHDLNRVDMISLTIYGKIVCKRLKHYAEKPHTKDKISRAALPQRWTNSRNLQRDFRNSRFHGL